MFPPLPSSSPPPPICSPFLLMRTKVHAPAFTPGTSPNYSGVQPLIIMPGNSNGPLRRWPGIPTYWEGPPLRDGRRQFTCRECPLVRWAFYQWTWQWWCEICQEPVGRDKGHFTSHMHKEQAAKQSADGFPDPSTWHSRGNLWKMTHGKGFFWQTGVKLVRILYSGWLPGLSSMAENHVDRVDSNYRMADDWEAVPVSFPDASQPV